MKKSGASQGRSASELISKRIAELGDWRGETLSRMRKLIKEADPDVVEEWKWTGTPIWSHDGIICTGESYKKVVKLTFAKGASLKDPARLFNSSLDGNARRSCSYSWPARHLGSGTGSKRLVSWSSLWIACRPRRYRLRSTESVARCQASARGSGVAVAVNASQTVGCGPRQ